MDEVFGEGNFVQLKCSYQDNDPGLGGSFIGRE